MNVNGIGYRTVWLEGASVFFIEQNLLPFEFVIKESSTYIESCHAIRSMMVRGAGAIGAIAGFAMAQAVLASSENNFLEFISHAKLEIEATRPTARNLFYATEKVFNAAIKSREAAVIAAQEIANRDAADSQRIGQFGNELIREGMNIETHCNAGWLAFVDYGTALSPIYLAHEEGKKIFVYADETRPRSQGARLTAWELNQAGVPHAIIPDNAGAWLMSLGKIDMVIVGADRIAANGDTANKIGTLEKAIAAKEYGIPFYVAAPTSTFDAACPDGSSIPIEERSEDEVLYMDGVNSAGNREKILVCSPGSHAINPSFDVTPARFISGIITEKGIIKPDQQSIHQLLSHNKFI
ncbi:MAG: S-methyl-5-thioribose-1-phosphate isomerase [Bacteroidetes bacterium]|nr:S-methyl-5-thioribose-1-phosphate isomerase [Bacteroidota bacterium]